MERFDSEELQAASVAFDFAARLVQVEPDEEWVSRCIEERLFDGAPFGAQDDAVAQGLALMARWCDGVKDDVAEKTKELQREWLRLFVGLGIPEASVNESYYTEPNSTLFGRSTLKAREAYRAWGLESERKATEPDDALGIMLAFCAHLMREAADGDSQVADKALAALERFLAEHMLPWASAWRFLVAQHAATDYYCGVGELVFGLERACAARFGMVFDGETGAFSYKRP